MVRDIYILYKKGELRCFFDKTTSEMLKRQEMCALFCFYHFVRVCLFLLFVRLCFIFGRLQTQTLWSSAKRSLKPSRFFETLKTSTFDWNYLIAPNFICELNKNGAFLVFVLSTLWGCQTCTGSGGLELPCCS